MFGEPKIPLGTYGPPLLRRAVTVSVKDAGAVWHIMGVPEQGKSYFLAGLYINLLNRGLAVSLIDPHGDLVRLVFETLVSQGYFRHPDAYKKLLYLPIPEAARKKRYAPLNVIDPNDPYKAARDFKEAMHRTWPALSGGAAPDFDKFIENGIKVLCSNNMPMPALWYFLDWNNKPFRAKLLQNEPDPEVRSFWADWYNRLSERLAYDYTRSLSSRINSLVFDPVIKHSLSLSGNVWTMRERILNNQSALVDLSLKNKETANLLGALMLVGAEQGALSLSDIPPGQRKYHHWLFVDEAGRFAARSGEAVSEMISETRKFGLHPVICHQEFSQISDKLRNALNMAAIKVFFKIGYEDAQMISPLLTTVDPYTLSVREEEGQKSVGIREQERITTDALAGQPRGHATVRLPNSQIVSIETLKMKVPTPDPKELEEVTNEYIYHVFKSEEEAERNMLNWRPQPVTIHR